MVGHFFTSMEVLITKVFRVFCLCLVYTAIYQGYSTSSDTLSFQRLDVITDTTLFFKSKMKKYSHI